MCFIDDSSFVLGRVSKIYQLVIFVFSAILETIKKAIIVLAFSGEVEAEKRDDKAHKHHYKA